MGTKDTITKDYMADNRVFADVFNHMLYKGKNIIDPGTLHPLDTTALAVPYGSGTSEVPVQKFRDEFKSLNVMHDDSRIYLLLGIENQSETHYVTQVQSNCVHEHVAKRNANVRFFAGQKHGLRCIRIRRAGRKFRQIPQRSKAMAFHIRRISHRLLQG